MLPSIEALIERLRPLEIEVNRAWWDAAVTGEASAYARLEEWRNRVDALYRDPAVFRSLEQAHTSGPADPLDARAAELLYLEAVPRQVEPRLGERMNRLATEIEREFSTYRPVVRGERRTSNDLDRVLRTARDEPLLVEAYEALKAVGGRVASRLGELVGLRNEAARAVGHDDYYRLRLALQEQDPAAIEALFDLLDVLVAGPFSRLKAALDERLAERFDRDPAELRPWHYSDQFFQEVPDVHGAALDATYADHDLVEIARRFYEGIGLPVAEILARSSLHEADGKDPHAFATDIDRQGDVRILLNLRSNERWMGTTLHELGHAVYDLGIDPGLPWVLRRPAHTLTTEAIAMLFGRLSRDAAWIRAMDVVDDAGHERIRQAVNLERRIQMLVFARWVQVMTRFERDLYSDPEQDLNDRWWSLVERHQGLTRPDRPEGAADYAAKIHVVAAPVYYHNYMLGECFASQLDRRLREDVLDGRTSYAGEPAVGAWLTERVFRPGARLHYDALARAATGAPVGPEAFVRQFVDD